RFQEGIIESHRIHSVRLDSRTDLVYQTLLASVVENAQLAALEITYGVPPGRIADMLESVRHSMLRTAEVLEQLIWHASRTAGSEKPHN
ncbi:MAG: histidine kinase, partial [Tardiphaga sp.]